MSVKAAYILAVLLAAPAAIYWWSNVWTMGFWGTTFSLDYFLLCLPMAAGNIMLAKAMISKLGL